jgi:RNA polymerase sigma-70 factor (ECF subfamily)
MTYGDPDARRQRFETLTLPLMQPLYDTALRFTADPDEAADGVQETYVRAFRTFDNFRPGTNARAWMFTILYSVLINRRKKSAREVTEPSVEELEARLRILDETTPPDWLGNVEAWGARWPAEVAAALGELPETFRAAVLLVDVHELSYEEAATALACPVGTVQSRVFRGRRLLFAALESYARRAGYSTGAGS